MGIFESGTNSTWTNKDDAGIISGPSSVPGLVGALNSKQDLSEKGQPGGYAALDNTGVIPASQLPPDNPDIALNTAKRHDPVTNSDGSIAISGQEVGVNISVAAGNAAVKNVDGIFVPEALADNIYTANGTLEGARTVDGQFTDPNFGFTANMPLNLLRLDAFDVTLAAFGNPNFVAARMALSSAYIGTEYEDSTIRYHDRYRAADGFHEISLEDLNGADGKTVSTISTSGFSMKTTSQLGDVTGISGAQTNTTANLDFCSPVLENSTVSVNGTVGVVGEVLGIVPGVDPNNGNPTATLGLVQAATVNTIFDNFTPVRGGTREVEIYQGEYFDTLIDTRANSNAFGFAHWEATGAGGTQVPKAGTYQDIRARIVRDKSGLNDNYAQIRLAHGSGDTSDIRINHHAPDGSTQAQVLLLTTLGGVVPVPPELLSYDFGEEYIDIEARFYAKPGTDSQEWNVHAAAGRITDMANSDSTATGRVTMKLEFVTLTKDQSLSVVDLDASAAAANYDLGAYAGASPTILNIQDNANGGSITSSDLIVGDTDVANYPNGCQILAIPENVTDTNTVLVDSSAVQTALVVEAGVVEISRELVGGGPLFNSAVDASPPGGGVVTGVEWRAQGSTGAYQANLQSLMPGSGGGSGIGPTPFSIEGRIIASGDLFLLTVDFWENGDGGWTGSSESSISGLGWRLHKLPGQDAGAYAEDLPLSAMASVLSPTLPVGKVDWVDGDYVSVLALDGVVEFFRSGGVFARREVKRTLNFLDHDDAGDPRYDVADGDGVAFLAENQRWIPVHNPCGNRRTQVDILNTDMTTWSTVGTVNVTATGEIAPNGAEYFDFQSPDAGLMGSEISQAPTTEFPEGLRLGLNYTHSFYIKKAAFDIGRFSINTKVNLDETNTTAPIQIYGFNPFTGVLESEHENGSQSTVGLVNADTGSPFIGRDVVGNAYDAGDAWRIDVVHNRLNAFIQQSIQIRAQDYDNNNGGGVTTTNNTNTIRVSAPRLPYKFESANKFTPGPVNFTTTGTGIRNDGTQVYHEVKFTPMVTAIYDLDFVMTSGSAPAGLGLSIGIDDGTTPGLVGFTDVFMTTNAQRLTNAVPNQHYFVGLQAGVEHTFRMWSGGSGVGITARLDSILDMTLASI